MLNFITFKETNSNKTHNLRTYYKLPCSLKSILYSMNAYLSSFLVWQPKHQTNACTNSWNILSSTNTFTISLLTYWYFTWIKIDIRWFDIALASRVCLNWSTLWLEDIVESYSFGFFSSSTPMWYIYGGINFGLFANNKQTIPFIIQMNLHWCYIFLYK